ncbi:MAG: hypothetical protein US76_00385 [Parcubacteria group bacterium GW2011_GWA2_38_13b]|nr:MAG: hypothetical protein US76_00385 [Parcubacteria group bacterium GW2011_GWA2_38_13b]
MATANSAIQTSNGVKYFLPFLLLILIWFKVAVLPAGAEVVLMASLAASFILPVNYFLSLILAVGLIFDRISALPPGILTVSLIFSVLLFLFLQRIFSLNFKSLFINLFIVLLFYEFLIWGCVEIAAQFADYRIIARNDLIIFFNNTFFTALAFNLIIIIFLSYWFGKRKVYEYFVKI